MRLLMDPVIPAQRSKRFQNRILYRLSSSSASNTARVSISQRCLSQGVRLSILGLLPLLTHEIQRTVLYFFKDSAQVFSQNPKADELYATEEQYSRHQ